MTPADRLRRGGRSSGFTIVEIAFIAVLLLLAIGGLSSAVLTTRQLAKVNEESAMADAAARQMLEQLHSVPFGDVFATFNTDPDDDPGGAPGTAPGTSFAVLGLSAAPDDGDGLPGRILFPTATVFGVEQLREDVVDDAMGMPRDLNGDGDDDDDASDDYVVLPVTVFIEWRGTAGRQSVQLSQLLYQ
jgi:hypothetical protein